MFCHFVVCLAPETRQSDHCGAQEPYLCHVPRRHTAKFESLPCAWESGTRQSLNLCRVPRTLHTAKNGFFAVCPGFCTRQRSQIQFCLFVDYVYGTPKHFIYITMSISCIRISIASIWYTDTNKLLFRPYKYWSSPYKFIQIKFKQIHTSGTKQVHTT